MSLTPDERRLEKLVKKEKPGLLSNLPGDKKKQLLEILGTRFAGTGEVLVHQQTTQVTTSPVPPAELLQGYNAAFPDGANRLFSMVESQSAHRQRLEGSVIKSQLDLAKKGQMFALFLAVFFACIGVLLAWMGHTVLAGTVFTTNIGGLVAAFIWGQSQQAKSLEKKAPK